jgi:hypothetical protein
MNGVIVGIESFHFNGARRQQAGLRVHNGIFSATLLIPVVNHQNFHVFP